MRRFTFLASLIVVLALAACDKPPSVASAGPPLKLHALFVGVDDYLYSDAGAAFSDLKGAVGDAQRFKQALAELYGLDLDKTKGGRCESANSVSTTLTNACATRARILAALDAKIAAAKAGETLLFYFAGHGSQYRDTDALDQDTGYNGTILPTDARNPDGSPGDIFDVELKALKDRATAAGIYFVTIFDSCNSATATRDGAAGQSRSVPPLTGAAVPAPASAAPAGPGGGYWVHLAAAQDGEEAQETASGAVGARAGVFTTALIETLRMPAMREAAFGDVIREVRLRVAKRGHVAQTPSAEGELTASLGSRTRSPVLFVATAKGATVTLNAGAFSGITRGSRFALYASQADAVAQKAVLVFATVATVDQSEAQLKLEGGVGAKLPKEMAAEEVAHFLPADLLEVSNDLPPGPAHEAAAAALSAIGFVTVSTAGATHLAPMDSGKVALRADDGTLLTDVLGDPQSDSFGQWLTAELRQVARAQQLLALRTTGQADMAANAPFQVTTCIDAEGYRPTACPPLQDGGVRKIAFDKRLGATLINRGAKPVYVYLLAIDPQNDVDLILPKPDEIDRPLAPNQPYRRSAKFNKPGSYRFVTIVTTQPINARAFEQGGNGARNFATPLERLLSSTSEGARDPGVTAVGDWSAQVTTALVIQKEPEQ